MPPTQTMSAQFPARKRFAADVGPCQCCGYPKNVTTTDAEPTVNVIGMWPQPNQGFEWRLCSKCTTELALAVVLVDRQLPEHTESIAGTSRTDAPAKSKLKVFGMTGYVDGTAGQQRIIVAAPTRAAACRAIGCTAGEFKSWGSETSNPGECHVARAEPGTVFHRGLDDRSDWLRKGEKPKPQGAIAQRAQSPSMSRAALNSTSPVIRAVAKRKIRKPRKYAAKVPTKGVTK